jgi:hypothetical protein
LNLPPTRPISAGNLPVLFPFYYPLSLFAILTLGVFLSFLTLYKYISFFIQRFSITNSLFVRLRSDHVLTCLLTFPYTILSRPKHDSSLSRPMLTVKPELV